MSAKRRCCSRPAEAGSDRAAYRPMVTQDGRRAQASGADVVVQATAASVTLSVADDGIGPADGPSAGHGLAKMADRAEALGGQFHVTARKPKGTFVQWTAPTRVEGARSDADKAVRP